MRSRSRRRRAGSSWTGVAFGRSRLRALWTTRPTQSSGRSKANISAPAANSSTKKPKPPSATSARLRSTAPRMKAGIAKTGSASTTASVSRFAAVNPAIAAPPRQPLLGEHAVLHGGPDRTSTRRDLRHRVARELRRRHPIPARTVKGDALKPPEADDGGGLQDEHHRHPARRKLGEAVPGGERVEQARAPRGRARRR